MQKSACQRGRFSVNTSLLLTNASRKRKPNGAAGHRKQSRTSPRQTENLASQHRLQLRVEGFPSGQFADLQNNAHRGCGNSSTARASAFQAEGCGFESRFPLHSCIFPFQSSFFLSKHVPWATTQGLMRAVARNREQAFETMLKVESTVTATNFILRETYNGQGKIRTQKAPR